MTARYKAMDNAGQQEDERLKLISAENDPGTLRTLPTLGHSVRYTRRGFLSHVGLATGLATLTPVIAACSGSGSARKSASATGTATSIAAQAALATTAPTIAPTAATASPSPTPAVGPAIQQQSVVYRRVSGKELILNLYLPAGRTTNRPTVVFFHGGGWAGGAPSEFEPQAKALAAKGYVACTAAYRFSNVAKFPAAVADAKAAVRWLRAHAADYRIDPKRIAAGGGSAGGYLAAMIATTPGMWEDGDDLTQSSVIQAAVLFNPATDLRHVTPGIQVLVLDFLGGTQEQLTEVYETASPITHVTSATPPTLILHGTADRTVLYAESVAYYDAVKAAGGVAELFPAQGADHAFFRGPPWYEQTLVAMETFLLRYL